MWRYYAFRALSGAWVHRELPLSDVRLTFTLSGPGGLTATIEPEYADLIGADGELVFREWDTVIVAEAAGQLRGGGILTGMDITGEQLNLDCVGFSGYAAGQPLASTLTWGGPTNGATGDGVDPAVVMQALWDHLQAQPDGSLGVVLDPLSTPYRLGAWHNARAINDDGTLGPAGEVEDPPIPIDRVPPTGYRKPAAATGKQVYWQYELPWWGDVEVGAKVDELCQQVPIDYRERWEWADAAREQVRMRLERGYPRLGRRSDRRFVEGENITELVTLRRSGEDFANAVTAYGAGEGSKQLRQSVSQRDGRLRRVRPVDASDVTTAAALRAVADAELGRASRLADITAFTLLDHPNAPIGSFAVGDDVLVQTTAGWQPTSMWVRITGYDLSPDTDTITVTCSRSDGFTYAGGGSG
jgi:hypothetical protein